MVAAMSAVVISAETTGSERVGRDPQDPDPHDIAVLVRDPAWRSAVAEVEACCRAAARATLAAAARATGRTAPAAAHALAIMLAGDDFLRRLNLRYRGRDEPTNVLAFPAGDGGSLARSHAEDMTPRALGDVAIARETMLREAAAQGKIPGDHLRHLVVHGVLHLFGYDHLTTADAAEMEAIEVAVLAGLGVTDPYAEPPRTGES